MRRRYVMVGGELLDAASVDNSRPTVPVVGDRHYDGLQATDGADISTRAKHRRYMREHGLTTVDDFTGEFTRAGKERERFLRGEARDPTLRADIARAIHTLQSRGKR